MNLLVLGNFYPRAHALALATHAPRGTSGCRHPGSLTGAVGAVSPARWLAGTTIPPHLGGPPPCSAGWLAGMPPPAIALCGGIPGRPGILAGQKRA